MEDAVNISKLREMIRPKRGAAMARKGQALSENAEHGIDEPDTDQ